MITEPDFRALCAELANTLDNLNHFPTSRLPSSKLADLVDVARAALSQPAPEPPTDEEIWAMYQDRQIGSFSPVEFARAVLARWGQGADRAEAGDAAD